MNSFLHSTISFRFSSMMLVFLVALFLPGLSVAQSSSKTDVEWLKTIQIPGNLIDKSNLIQPLGPGLWQDLFGGISALEYLGHDDLYLALPDRGPLDGAIDWSCRIQLIQLTPHLSSSDDFRIVKTILLKDGGKNFSGLSTSYTESETTTKRLDPEGLRSWKDHWFLTDEYGPQVIEFSNDGKMVKKHIVPARYRIANPGPTKKDENTANQSGRQGNRGMEGLAISGNGDKLFGLMQSPLLQDSERNSNGKPFGLNCRILAMDLSSGTTREFLYPLDSVDNKLNEILAINDHEFLVIERDGEIGNQAKYKKIIKIDTSRASDIANIEKLPATQLPDGVTPVQKDVFIDLLDPAFGLSGDSMPEKIESLTFGSNLADGRKTLLIASDNDFKTNQPTLIYCFALGKQESNVIDNFNNKMNSISKR